MIKRPVLTTVLYTTWIVLHMATYMIIGFWLGLEGDSSDAAFAWWAIGWILFTPTVAAPPIIYYSLTDQ